VSFDFDSFSFHVPSKGSAAYNPPAIKIIPKLSAIVLVFIFFVVVFISLICFEHSSPKFAREQGAKKSSGKVDADDIR
jgi:hypothetical protein